MLVGLGLWMTIERGDGTLRLPADWIVSEATPVEVPTANGPLDLRSLAREALLYGRSPAHLADPDGDPFTVRVVRTVDDGVPVAV